MCDTVVVTPEASADGVMLFGKNSDRDPNEAQYLLAVPAAEHDSGSRVMCTYLKIDQVAHTHACLLSRPFWIWGAEMGINEHGVAIGNEAVFTRAPRERALGLIGMDLLRLGLERAESAPGAIEVITGLLERHGQGGSCGYRRPFFYDNSFIIADPHEAWILETAGRAWAARRVRGVGTISNGLTIDRDWDASSAGQDRASAAGFAACHSDRLISGLSNCSARRARTAALLAAGPGKAGIERVMAVLRDHGPGEWRPDRGLTASTVCMHAGYGPVRRSQTAGSLACRLDGGNPLAFATATSAPCLGVFKPVWLDAPPDFGRQPDGTCNTDTLYWRHEKFHRIVLEDYAARAHAGREERDALERAFVAGAAERADRPPAERRAYTAECFAAADAALGRWTAAAAARPACRRLHPLYAAARRSSDREAGLL
jgi:secernin